MALCGKWPKKAGKAKDEYDRPSTKRRRRCAAARSATRSSTTSTAEGGRRPDLGARPDGARRRTRRAGGRSPRSSPPPPQPSRRGTLLAPMMRDVTQQQQRVYYGVCVLLTYNMMARAHRTRRCLTGQTWSTVDACHLKGRQEGARTQRADESVGTRPLPREMSRATRWRRAARRRVRGRGESTRAISGFFGPLRVDHLRPAARVVPARRAERSGFDSGSLPWRIDERRERRGGESRLVVVRTHAERVIAGRDRRERACDELHGSSASLPRVHVVWRPRRRSACASAGRSGEAG